MDMVFRGERSKKGRYRQFRQCDIDIVGREELDLLYDALILVVIVEIFSSIDIGKFLIRINNRKVLSGFFEGIGVSKEQVESCIKIVDKLDKLGEIKVKELLLLEGLSESQSGAIIIFTQISGDTSDVINQLETQCNELGNPSDFLVGITELKTVIQGVQSLGISKEYYCIDLSIARGLNYYTGTVYETTLIGYESLGSICSGGRYEELVSMFTEVKMPGVGISIELTRLVHHLLDTNTLQALTTSPAQIMVANLRPDLVHICLQISQTLRQAGFNIWTELGNRKLKKQLEYANRLGIPLCLIIGSNEYIVGKCCIKDLRTGEQFNILLEDLVDKVQSLLTRRIS